MFAEQFVKVKRVLDAGCGVGYGAALMAEFGAREIVAIDIDGESIEAARQTYVFPNVTFHIDDSETLNTVTGEFDVVCSFENIEHLLNPDHFLSRVTELLRDDGVLICSTTDPRGPYCKCQNGRTANPYHVNEWHAREFEGLLHRYFGDIDMRQQVQALSAYRRRIAAIELDGLLGRIWASPLRRLARGAQRLFGKHYDWPHILEIANPSPADYPIVASRVSHLFGVPYCHVAICRMPTRRE